jgi:hypothetical protein
MFIIVFMVYFVNSKQIQSEIFGLAGKTISLIVTTMVCEVFTLLGYFSSVYAY